jgi:hypothetical protein
VTPEEQARADALYEREIEIQSRLREEYPHDAVFLRQAEEFVDHVRYARQEFSRWLARVGTFLSENQTRNALTEYRTAKFYLVALISTPSTIEDFLYRRSKSLAGISKEILHSVIDEWKCLPSTRIVKIMRQKVQHGSLLDGSVVVQSRSLSYELDAGIWRKLLEGSTTEVREYHRTTLEPLPDPLGYVLEEYELGVARLAQELRRKIDEQLDPDVQAIRTQLQVDLAAVRQEAKQFWNSVTL